jgi:hypothetical protein
MGVRALFVWFFPIRGSDSPGFIGNNAERAMTARVDSLLCELLHSHPRWPVAFGSQQALATRLSR